LQTSLTKARQLLTFQKNNSGFTAVFLTQYL
jgi:hypothetical protein